VREKEIFVYARNLPPDTGRRMGLLRQFSDPEEMMRRAAAYAPGGARVHVFPHGGVTYPLPL
jgi:hypothetical protein